MQLTQLTQLTHPTGTRRGAGCCCSVAAAASVPARAFGAANASIRALHTHSPDHPAADTSPNRITCDVLVWRRSDG